MREMTRKLYSQYEEKLQEEEEKHKLEKETLLVRGTFPDIPFGRAAAVSADQG